jgi:hypothetical protein
MATLLRGTTLRRAGQLIAQGPDPEAAEFGASGFSTCLESGPFPLGTPAEYARRKAALFPEEAGPVILAIEVPDEMIARAIDEFFPLTQGIVQFDSGRGLDELRAAWTDLRKYLIPIESA